MAFLKPDQQKALSERFIRRAGEHEARMVGVLRGAPTANLGQLRKIATICSGETTALQGEAMEWAQRLLPRLYREGVGNMDAAMARRRLTGRAVRIAGRAHTRAIEVRIESFLRVIARAAEAADESVLKYLSEFTDAQIRSGLKGSIQALKSVPDLTEALSRGRILAYVDTCGRAWGLTAHVGTVTRTEVRDSLNAGFKNRAREFGIDLVRVSEHGGACELCAPWEGAVLSLDGETEGYATTDEAEAAGLMHHNCYHMYEPIAPGSAA